MGLASEIVKLESAREKKFHKYFYHESVLDYTIPSKIKNYRTQNYENRACGALWPVGHYGRNTKLTYTVSELGTTHGAART